MSHCRNGTPCWCLPILLEHDLSPYGQKSRSCFTTKQSIIWEVHVGQILFEVAIDLKSDNLQYDVLDRWVDCLIDQASDGSSIII